MKVVSIGHDQIHDVVVTLTKMLLAAGVPLETVLQSLNDAPIERFNHLKEQYPDDFDLDAEIEEEDLVYFKEKKVADWRIKQYGVDINGETIVIEGYIGEN